MINNNERTNIMKQCVECGCTPKNDEWAVNSDKHAWIVNRSTTTITMRVVKKNKREQIILPSQWIEVSYELQSK